MSQSPVDPKIGRCQRCEQVRPVWYHDGKGNDGQLIWVHPLPDYWPTTGAWLCVRDYSAAETARENGRTIKVNHMIEVEFWRRRMGHGPMNARIYIEGGELLTQSDQDLNTCEAILATT